MNTERIQQRLGVETSKISVNTDTYIKINIDGKERLLPPDEINKIVNVGERFNIERQRSKFYRILGTVNPTISNVLFNLNDSSLLDKSTWAVFNSYDFLDTSYPKDNTLDDITDLTYAQAIKKALKERDGWFGYTDPDITKSGFCNFIDMEPKRERFSMVPDVSPYHAPSSQPVKNWELTITYPYSKDDSHYMVSGATGNGLLIVDALPAVVATRNMVAFGLPCLHNLTIGDTITITGTSGFNGTHVVIRTGLDNGDLKGYYFVIDMPLTGGTITGLSRVKRIFGGQESEYYFRIFRKIKTRSAPIIEEDDYETYPLAFSENIYSDVISQYVFNEDVDITDLTDNLGRPLSELYLTIIKTDSNSLFTPVSSGLETPFISNLNTSGVNTYLQNVPVINKIHNGGSVPFQTHVPLETAITIGNYDYYGDIVEYNKYEVKETVLGEVSHRFNTLNRETSASISYVSTLGTTPATTTVNLGPRQEGYFYKPHHLIRIKDFSNYVEQGDSFTEGIPEYAVNLGDGRYLWRDLLDIGFNESNEKIIDYPFLNGCHYLYQNNCFYLRRQDPFDNWGLFYGKFPADPIGERMTDNFTTNSADDVC